MMRRSGPVRTALAVALLSASAPASAQQALEAELAERIEAATDCSVDYLSRLQDRRQDDPGRVSARVHCRDGTAYDVQWWPGSDRFRFERCSTGKMCGPAQPGADGKEVRG
jgi:glucose-6-phosphate dehydrogenase assembly protein OpcA